MKPYNIYQYGMNNEIISEKRLDQIISSTGTRKGHSWTGEHPHGYSRFEGKYALAYDRSNPPVPLSTRWMSQATLDRGDDIPEWNFEPNKHRLDVNSVCVDLAELLATRKESISMVSKTVSTLGKAAMDVRRGNIKRAADRLNISKPQGIGKSNMPGNWLALQYGWLPLVGDVYTSIAGEMVKAPSPVPVYTVQKDRRSYSRWHLSGSIYNQTYVYCNFTEDRVMRQVTLVRARVNTVNAVSQLGLTNPALLAWNLLPYSFVVDWFYPVGDALEAMGALHGVDVVRSSTSYRTRSFKEYTGYWGERSGNASTMTVSKERYLGFPSVELPRFQNPLSLSHFANGMSLLAEAFRRKA